ncbi:MAG: hypothetical protein AB7F59_03735 [Bdellovibrionales bacterium]
MIFKFTVPMIAVITLVGCQAQFKAANGPGQTSTVAPAAPPPLPTPYSQNQQQPAAAQNSATPAASNNHSQEQQQNPMPSRNQNNERPVLHEDPYEISTDMSHCEPDCGPSRPLPQPTNNKPVENKKPPVGTPMIISKPTKPPVVLIPMPPKTQPTTPAPTPTPAPVPTPAPTQTQKPQPKGTLINIGQPRQVTLIPMPKKLESDVGCNKKTIQQPQLKLKKLDLLFVLDTSNSLFKERGAVAEGIDQFISKLPADIDFRIGVMAGHGSKSTLTGQLYKKASSSEPLVLNSSELSSQQLRLTLKDKLTQIPGDRLSDGGEMSMYSLNKAFDTMNVSKMKSAGFLREDAALAVIFFADENDICAQYPSGVKPKIDKQGQENLIKKSGVCTGITALGIVKKIQSVKGKQPVALNGILYTDDRTIKNHDRSDAWSEENEVGYGYTDMIRLSNGIVVDLAKGNYAEALSKIGEKVNMKLSTSLEIPLAARSKDYSIRVESVTMNGQELPRVGYEKENGYNHAQELESVHLLSGSPGAMVEIEYCEQAN